MKCYEVSRYVNSQYFHYSWMNFKILRDLINFMNGGEMNLEETSRNLHKTYIETN